MQKTYVVVKKNNNVKLLIAVVWVIPQNIFFFSSIYQCLFNEIQFFLSLIFYDKTETHYHILKDIRPLIPLFWILFVLADKFTIKQALASSEKESEKKSI
jgi:hypothetical protein